MLSISLELTPEKISMWADHPLGKGLAMNAISYFEARKDAE